MEVRARKSDITAIWVTSKPVRTALAGSTKPMRKSCYTDPTQFSVVPVSAMLVSMTSVRAVMSYHLRLATPVAASLAV